ncbi:uncharacterized protein LOC126678336 [Mercurialis annua]|uniref:uncharacterized protein LOC126678336 n=1 Tax=Mercurialis annua TaxID=3986 RepID=UPI0021606654|nr:uncharacterized protein LOC126678336 [Mercurialis annua]
MQHNRQWNEEGRFIDFQITGLLLEMDCTFKDFYEIVYQRLLLQDSAVQLDIKFLIRDNYPPMKIEDEGSLRFYLELKKNENNFTKYPICVVINKIESRKLMESSSSSAANKENSSSFVYEDNTSRLYDQSYGSKEISNTNMDMIEYENLLCDLQENLPEHDFEEDIAPNIQVNQKIEEGGIFIDKETLITDMSLYGLADHFQYKVVKSCTRQYRLKCIDDYCEWKFYASRIGHTKMFQVRTFSNSHTCSLEVRMGENKYVSSRTIAKIIKPNLLDVKTIYTPNDIIRDMRNDHRIKLDYWKAWKCREIEMELLRGKPENSFAQLPRYFYMIQQTNPGSVVMLKKDENNSFLYAFMSLKASISGWNHCIPIMIVDGTFLKGPYGGTLFSASTHDAAGKIFPLAFAVTDSENDVSWNWFFTNIKSVFGVREKMCIISDRHDSIKKAIESVFEGEVQHDICIFHLLNNVKYKFKKQHKKIKDLFMAAARSYTKTEFKIHMDELHKISPKLTEYLNEVGLKKWAVSHSVNKRYNILTSNTIESFNAAVNRTRELPVTMLMEYLRNLVQRWSCKNKNLAKGTFTKLSTKYETIFRENYLESMELKVDGTSDEYIFSVIDLGSTFTVNMKDRTCTCNKFQVDMLPCRHASAVCYDKHQDPHEYCSNYFTNEKMLATYEEVVYPVNKEDTWDIPTEVENYIVLPPVGRIKAGRPKKRRIKGVVEHQTQNRCTAYGHNRKTCRKPKKK